MTTYTNKDKLYTLAVAAGQSAKSGNMAVAIKQLNIIASLMTEEDKAEAGKIALELSKGDNKIPNVKNYISAHHMEIEDPESEPHHLIDISKFTHEEALFMLVVLLGGNMHGISKDEDRKEREKAARNVNELLNMIARTVTKEDWDKAREMSERDREDPEDPFKAFSA